MTLENDTESNLLFTLGGSNKGQLYIDSNGVNLRSESGEDLRLLTGGNNTRMFISGSGNVGIGTTSPDYLLEVEKSSNAYMQAWTRTSGAKGGLWVSTTGVSLETIGAYTLGFGVNGSGGHLVISGSNGNVGIGETAPGSALHISSHDAGAAGPVLTLEHDSANPANSDVIGKIRFLADNDSNLSEEWAHIRAEIADVRASEEDGKLIFSTVVGDTDTDVMTLYDGNAIINSTGALVLTPRSTPTATEGQIYYDSTSNLVLAYNGSAWETLTNTYQPEASGGTITSYSSGGVNYMVHTFTTSGTFTPAIAGDVDILVVAGGGGGGYDVGGGGGAGGMGVWADKSLTAIAYTVTVGAGGATGDSAGQTGYSGGDSSFGSLGAVDAGGGGGSWASSQAGVTGGSSGGHSGWTYNNGTSTSATYNTSGVALSGGLVYGAVGGYNTANASNTQGAGGGGAGGVGGNAIAQGSPSGRTENGGDGKASSIRTGTNVTYARGGCGGNDSGGAEGFRGAGDANTGEGGAGAGGSTGQAGGSGIIIIRYAI
jgi:hypothetical protein